MNDISVELEGFGSDVNAQLTRRLLSELSKLPGGNDLKNEARQRGDIRINLTRDLVAGGAHWDIYTRTINVHIPCSPKDLLEDDKAQDKIFLTILFELCNAANPLMTADPKGSPLTYPNAETYAREAERLEFPSYLRNARIVNMCVAQGLSGWEESDKFPVFEEAEFDRYFTEISDKPMPEVYKEQGTHANYYRNGFRMAYSKVQAGLLEILSFIQHAPNIDVSSVKIIKPQVELQYFDDVLKAFSLLLQAKTLEDYEKLDFQKIDLGKIREIFDNYKDRLEANISIFGKFIKTEKEYLEKLQYALTEFEKVKRPMHIDIVRLLKMNEVIAIIQDKQKEISFYIAKFEELKSMQERELQSSTDFLSVFRHSAQQIVIDAKRTVEEAKLLRDFIEWMTKKTTQTPEEIEQLSRVLGFSSHESKASGLGRRRP